MSQLMRGARTQSTDATGDSQDVVAAFRSAEPGETRGGDHVLTCRRLGRTATPPRRWWHRLLR